MKKTLNIFSTVLMWGLIVFTVGMMIFTFISVSMFNQANRSVFGYKFFVVTSDSMSATDFSSGDVIFVKETDASTLRPGDIIAFVSTNPETYGGTVTHKIREITVNSNGKPAFVTYGTTTNVNDETLVEYSHVLGKYSGKIPDIGNFLQYLKTTQGYFCFIFIPFFLLMLYFGLQSILTFRSYKKERLEIIETERVQIEEERRQFLEMAKELQELKAQLSERDKDSDQ